MRHVIEHGVMRQVADEAHKIFEFASEYGGLSKSEFSDIANQRIMDLSSSLGIRRFAPFRKNALEKQAGITGQMRREINPFLWYSVMGLSRNCSPDNDRYVQLLLRLDLLYRELVGTNQPPKQLERTENEIDNLGQLAYEMGKELTILLEGSVNMKTHRTMYHIPNHLFDYGCIRKGSTDSNETLHKNTKKSYNSTNKQTLRLAPQILSVRTVLHVNEAQEEPVERHNTKHLVTRRSLYEENQILNETPYHICENLKLVRNRISGVTSPAEADQTVLEACNQFSGSQLWTKMVSARFIASFEWCQLKVSDVVYAVSGDSAVEGKKDAIVYSSDDAIHRGILESLYSSRDTTDFKVALIRRLRHIPPDSGNVNIVNIFGHQHYEYDIVDGCLQMDFVPITSLSRKAVILPNPWRVVKVLRHRTRLNALPDTEMFRKKISFFEIAGFKHTAFAEQD